MSAADVLIWVLRVFGALYFVGGVWMARQMWFWARIGGVVETFADQIERAAVDGDRIAPDPAEQDDTGRSWWLFAGAALTALSGAAMLLGHRLAPALLALLIAQQLCYFIRQHRRERRALNPQAARDERPSQISINGFYSAAIMAVLAAWLGAQGVFWG